MTRRTIALVVALAAAATLAGAYAFQLAGYAPCELCLKERIPYLVGAPLALIAFALTARAEGLARACLALVALVFAAGTALGTYHAGIEFGWWPGPSDCTGAYTAAPTQADFLKQLQDVQVVRCDAVALRIMGLSLAAWDAVVSAGLTAMAAAGAMRRA